MRFLVAAAVASSLASCSLAAANHCKLEGPSIGTFDLSPLRNKAHDYTATNPDGGAVSLNFCGPVSSDESPAEAAQNYGAYIEDSRGGISLGESSNKLSYHNGQLSVTYKNGAECPNSSARRSSLIYLQCDNSWTSDNKVTLIDSLDECVYFFTIKTPYACAASGGFFSAVWGVFVFLFWLSVVVGGALFAYSRFFGNRGGRTLGDSGSGGLGNAVSFAKDMLVVGGIWIIDTAQNAYHALSSRRNARSQAYQYAYDPAPTAPRAAGGHSSSSSSQQQQPDYSSAAWKAPSAGGTGAATPPPPPAKSASPPQSGHNPLAGGGSLLEDDEDEDDEDALAMPGTQGKGAQLV
ncbi:mannose-6-phosphate receptor binding domain-containing protein [Rhodotorula diobovata]|uniref:Mannose-6-phosphate receptor binding domain-containing protein n=1 Tax=Rhodotorula diobovata TaxID=5288 RepID=A0A5C5FQM5_9BASI|nr:mannose-6-phosphate receptor binding domain-containing protein [Rhodotorula diobovata]